MFGFGSKPYYPLTNILNTNRICLKIILIFKLPKSESPDIKPTQRVTIWHFSINGSKFAIAENRNEI
jgi:hypothetical protein